MKKIIILLACVVNAMSFSAVERNLLRDGTIRLSYSGSDLSTFRFLREALVESNSRIRTKCFKETVSGGFGEPVQIEKCAVLLAAEVDYTVLNPNRGLGSLRTKLLKIQDEKLEDILRRKIKGQKNYVLRISKPETRRVCTGANTGRTCDTVLRDIVKYRTVGKLYGDPKREGSLVCANENYFQNGVTAIQGCFIVPTASNRRAQKLNPEKPNCNEIIKGKFRIYIDAEGTKRERFIVDPEVNAISNRFSELDWHNKLDKDERDWFDFEITKLRYYGKHIHDEKVKCEGSVTGALNDEVAITCENKLDHSVFISRYAGSSYVNFGELEVRACNYFKDALN